MLETSAFKIFHSGNYTFINSFDKTAKFSFSLSQAAPRLFSKLEIFRGWNDTKESTSTRA